MSAILTSAGTRLRCKSMIRHLWFLCILLTAPSLMADEKELRIPRPGATWTAAPPPTAAPTPTFEAADLEAMRDPRLIQIGDLWHCYYTLRTEKEGAVYCRTSANLKAWSAPKMVAAGSKAAAFGVALVVQPEPGQFYLFRGQSIAKKAVARVYFSQDPMNFGTDKNADALHAVCNLPMALRDVYQSDGKWFIKAQRNGGLQVAALDWQPLVGRAARPDKKDVIRVALFDDYGSFGKGVPRVKELLSSVGGVELTLFKPDFLSRNGLRDYDVVIFTGGSGSKQANTIGLAGREAVRRFVHGGGGYIGICAGNYLACDGFSWGVKVLDAKTKSSKWMRGQGDVQVEFTELGRQILGMPAGLLPVRYANGPVFQPADKDEIGDFQPLAIFRTELAENGSPVGVMTGSAAMVAGSYGKGRVLCSSPHPEQTQGMEQFIERAVRWAGSSDAAGQ